MLGRAGRPTAPEVTGTERLADDRWRFETVRREDNGDPALTGDATVVIDD